MYFLYVRDDKTRFYMNKTDLLKRLTDIEWDDFEVEKEVIVLCSGKKFL